MIVALLSLHTSSSTKNECFHLAHSPKGNRSRGHDKSTFGPICKTRSLGHLILPGILTLFCEHGNAYIIVQEMSVYNT